MIVYCHEYLSDRWSFHPYVDHLRDLGYDLFTFDFRNHGASDLEAGYAPMQWTSDREVSDLRAALRPTCGRVPITTRPGFGLFGVSRGGTTALLAAAVEHDVWGVMTDGAFPTRGTMVPVHHSLGRDLRAEPFIRRLMPGWLYSFWRGVPGGRRNGA